MNSISESKVRYFQENLNQRIDSFKKFRQKSKQRAFLLKMLATSMSAATTIVLGLQGLEGTSLVAVKNVALVFSAFVTLFSIWDSFFNYREQWIVYCNITSQLSNIKYKLEYITTGKANHFNEDEVDKLHNAYLEILSNSTDQISRIKSEGAQSK
jgi:Protein of unknown function (DUF4231)